MIAILDVKYGIDLAYTACIIIENWTDEEPVNEYIARIDNPAPYESGKFYRRELPCLTAALDLVKESVDCIVIDGNVTLGAEEKRGLGMYLYDYYNQKIPVIGVAKSPYKDTPEKNAVYRGESAKPLYVTSVGIDYEQAKKYIHSMFGEYRLPKMIKAADSLCNNQMW